MAVDFLQFQRLKIQDQGTSGVGFSEGSPPGLQMATSSLRLIWALLCALGNSEIFSISSCSYKNTSLLGLQPHPYNLIFSFKALYPNRVILGVRGRDAIQFKTYTELNLNKSG